MINQGGTKQMSLQKIKKTFNRHPETFIPWPQIL